MSIPASRPPIAILAFVATVAAPQLPGQVTATCAGVNITTQRAVYVSPAGTDSASCGSSAAAACQTIQRGIGNCTGAGCSVLVRHGLYRVTAPVTLAKGVSVYGSCSFDGSPIPYRTIVAGPSPVVTANQINIPTTMHGLVVNADDATNPGQASIAMIVSDSFTLSFSHNVLASGKGANGAQGVYADGGSGGGGSYPSGISGGPGGPACPASRNSADGDGGQGADYNQIFSGGCVGWCHTCNNVNSPNNLGRSGHNSATVSGGGGGGPGSAGCACQSGDAGDGSPGTPGNPGSCGTQGGAQSTNTVGSFNGTTWVPSAGGAGDTGKVGSGGGGGGSGGFAAVLVLGQGTQDFEGNPGGGGGGGGCGGPGGGGGGQGGASIPLVLVSSLQFVASTNVLIPGPGGRGGDGAAGGVGGPGGPGQNGGQMPKVNIDVVWICSGNSPGWGGRGAVGGQGGAGSGGAGGNGGPSFGIARVGGSYVLNSVRTYPANPGATGAGAAGGQNVSTQCQGAHGQVGLAGFANDQNSVVTY